jgi:ATPase subunit of ABC transporter with duplicated ATPase domains
MIRAIANTVLIISHASVARQKGQYSIPRHQQKSDEEHDETQAAHKKTSLPRCRLEHRTRDIVAQPGPTKRSKQRAKRCSSGPSTLRTESPGAIALSAPNGASV